MFANPFRPGAGHMPPTLAGRADERDIFEKLLLQQIITDNAILTGLRGVGKTVLLESLKPIAREANWLWVGDDFTESVSLTEERVAERLVTDLSLTLAPIFLRSQFELSMGFMDPPKSKKQPLTYDDLRNVYNETPGLTADKLKSVLRFVGSLIKGTNFNGIVFAYDEAQNLADRSSDNEYPLSLLLDTFQSIQKSPGGLPFILVLSGLPTLFPKLNEARTYTERMFAVLLLEKLTYDESHQAITEPIDDANCPITFADETVDRIIEMSGGYPYFIQFICKEVYDVWINQMDAGENPEVPAVDIIRKLDQRFFSARWDKASDRQREFMIVTALLPTAKTEFTVQEVVQSSNETLDNPFNTSSAGMMLKTLTEAGFIFRNRRGKYIFAVPLLDDFIRRQIDGSVNLPAPFDDSNVR